MKVFEARPGYRAGPWYFVLHAEPRFHTFEIASARLTVTIEDGDDLVFDTTPEVTIDNEGRVVVELDAATVNLLGTRKTRPFKLDILDTEGREWQPEGDGAGYIKTSG